MGKYLQTLIQSQVLYFYIMVYIILFQIINVNNQN